MNECMSGLTVSMIVISVITLFSMVIYLKIRDHKAKDHKIGMYKPVTAINTKPRAMTASTLKTANNASEEGK